MRILRSLLLVAILAACNGCPAPIPVGPGPAVGDAGLAPDVFTSKILNCRLPVVAVERDDALGDVRGCLLLGERAIVAGCLVNKTSQYQPTSVGCVARDLGAKANAAYLAGSTDPNDKEVADVVRTWISDHRLGFVSVEVSQ